ncbi:MAG: hypothetical protein NZ580_03680 [Bacteroidia bacterium]|nr:hypothetical protein [Bacteroidia bacterium]MDW8235149.1 hypothetical protein [Bacteroidia bacterium]
MRKLFALIAGVGTYLWAQEVDSRVPIYRMSVFKLYPLALMDPFQLAVQGAMELPVSRKNSTQIEAGWVFGYLAEVLPYQDNTQRGFKARLEWREYLTEASPDKPQYTLTGIYASAQLGYQYYYQNMGGIDTSFYSPGTPTRTKTYERTIQALSINGLLGFQGAIGRRIAVDLFWGMGIRYTLHQWGPLVPPDPDLVEKMPVGDLILRKGVRPIPRFGIAFGWIL